MRLSIKNFRSHDSSEFIFEKNKIILIDGVSGSGKSTIFNSIYWCLYGSMQHIFNNNKDKLSVEIEFGNLKITRKKKPDILIVEIDDKKYEDDVAQEIIIHYFGSKELWLASCYLKQGERNNLLCSTNSEKLKLIEELSFSDENPQEYIEKISEKLETETKNYNIKRALFEEKYKNMDIIDEKLYKEIDIEKNKILLAKLEEENIKQKIIESKIKYLNEEMKYIDSEIEKIIFYEIDEADLIRIEKLFNDKVKILQYFTIKKKIEELGDVTEFYTKKDLDEWDEKKEKYDFFSGLFFSLGGQNYCLEEINLINGMIERFKYHRNLIMKEQLKIYENIDRMNNEIGKIRIDEKLYAKTLNMKSLAEKYGLIYDENLDETLKNLRVIKEKLEKIRKNKKLDEYVDVEPQSEDGLLQCMRENETYKKYLQISDDIEEVKEYIKKLDILDRYYLLENQYKKEKELLELESKLDPGLIPVKDLNKALLEQEQRNNFIRILNQYDMKYNEEVVTDIQFRIFLEKESEYYRYLIPIPSKSRDEELENINHKIMISSLKLYECPNCKKTLQYTDLGLKLCDFEPLIHEDYDELIKIRNDIIIDIDKRKKFMEWKKNQKLTENFSSDEDFIEFLSSETVPESLKNIRYIEYIKDPRINHESYLSLKKIKNMKHMEKKDIQAYEELRKEYIKIKDLIPKLKNLSFLEKIPINLEKYKRGIEKAKLGDYEIVNETEEELLDKYVDVPEHLIYLDPTIIYEKKELDRLRDELIGLNRMIKMRRNEIKIIDMEIPDNFSDDEFFSDKFYEIKLDRIEYIEIRNTRKEIEKSILYQDLTNKIDHKYTENDLIIVSDKSLAIDMIEKRKKLESNKSNEMRVKLLHDKKNRISYDLKNLFLDETLEYRIQKLKDKIEEEEKQKKINEKVLSYIEEKNKKNKDEEKIIQINENINNLNELKIIAINTEYKYLQNIIDIINENIKEMTSDLFDDHINIKINLFKILKSQKYKPQINLTINYRGSDYDNINQLSGGESARISLIITMALNKFNKFPFLLLDESMASFDDNLRESSLRTLKKHISKGILCINHSETEGNYDNIIRI